VKAWPGGSIGNVMAEWNVVRAVSGQENKAVYIETEIARLEMKIMFQVLVLLKVVVTVKREKISKDKVYFPGML
jgi:transcription antitermination factor NusG